MVCAVNDDGETPERLLASTVTLTTEVAMSSARTVTSFPGWNLTVPGLVTMLHTSSLLSWGFSEAIKAWDAYGSACVCVRVCVYSPLGWTLTNKKHELVDKFFLLCLLVQLP